MLSVYSAIRNNRSLFPYVSAAADSCYVAKLLRRVASARAEPSVQILLNQFCPYFFFRYACDMDTLIAVDVSGQDRDVSLGCIEFLCEEFDQSLVRFTFDWRGLETDFECAINHAADFVL